MFKKEYLLAVVIGIVVLFFSNLYLLSGILEPKSDLVFLGRRVINSQDAYTYVSFIEQARQGRVLFENLYTSEPQNATLLRPSYTLLGLLAFLGNTSSIGAYHIGRIFFSILFLFVLYIFIKQFFDTPKKRLLAFSIILFSSGLGFIAGGFLPESADLWIPEAITFLSIQEAPHFILSQTLMLLAFMFLLKGWRSGRVKYFVFSFLTLFFLGFEHPYNLFTIGLTVIFMAIYLWITKKVTGKVLLMGLSGTILGCIVGNAYQLVEFMRNPILRSWAFPSPSPIPMNYIVGYGLIMVFAVFGLEIFLRERKMPQVLIVCWVVATSVVLYSPIYFQRRLSEGFHIPLAILATEGVIIVSIFLSKFVLKEVRKAVLYITVCMLTFIMMIGTFVGVYSDVTTISQNSKASYYYYLLAQEVEAMDFLRDNMGPHDIVLSNWFYGNIIPGIAGRKVFIGHKAQTTQFDKKVDLVNKFILSKDTNQAYQFLKTNNITYVYVGKNDSMLRYGFKPSEKPYLVKVFDEGEAKVYKVR